MRIAAAIVLVATSAAASPANHVEASLQAGVVMENPAIGPQLGYSRRVTSWRRVELLVGTTQVYRLTPALGDPAEFGAGSSRTEYRHHWSALFGPGVSIRLPPGDRLAVGADLLGGFAFVGIHGRFVNPAQGVDRAYSGSDVRGLVGARLSSSFRVGARWSALVSYWQPLHEAPTSSWHVGLGAATAF